MQNNLKLDVMLDAPAAYKFGNNTSTGQLSFMPTHKELLKISLFTPQDCMVHKPLTLWAAELRAVIHTLPSGSAKIDVAESMAALYEQAAMIFIARDQFQQAREICYSQIQMFIHWSHKYRHNELLKFVFQPWINLIRIDRLTKNFHTAANKINALHCVNGSEIFLGDNKLLPQLLYDAIQADAKVIHEIQTDGMVERIKIFFVIKHYNELLKYINLQLDQNNIAHKNILYESKIVALANSGRIGEACDLAGSIKPGTDLIITNIFKLRESELYIAAAGKQAQRHTISQVYDFSVTLFKNNPMSARDLLFVLHTAHLLQLYGFIDEPLTLNYLCLEAAERIQDDWLKTESLVNLHHLVYASQDRKTIEDMMIRHYFHTHYVAARHKMAHCFPDLKHVEKSSCQVELTSLFEELLTLSQH